MNIRSKSRKNLIFLILDFFNSKRNICIAVIFCYILFWNVTHYMIPKTVGTITGLLKSSSLNNECLLNLEINQKILKYFCFYFSVWVLGDFAYFIAGRMFSKILPFFEVKIKELVFNNLQSMPYDFFLNYSEGFLTKSIDIFGHNITFVFEFLIQKAIPAIIVFIFILFHFFTYNWIIGLILLSWTILHFCISFYFFNELKNLGREYTTLHGKVNSIISDGIKNIKIQEYFNLQNYWFENLKTAQAKSAKNQENNMNVIWKIKLLKGLFCVLFQGIFLNLLLFSLWKNGSIGFTEFITLTQMNGGVIHIVWHISERLPECLSCFTKCQSLLQFLEKDQQEFRKHKHLNLLNVKGNIKIQNISFTYKDLRNSTEKITNKVKKIIEDFSFEIKQGEKILILGYSGIGKSTFLDILSGLLCEYEGSIFFDGVNIKTINKDLLSNYCTFITNFGILNGSIGENIALNTDYNETEVRNLLKKVSLNLDPKINLTSSSNCFLSEGEKQRVLIARAFFRKKANIIFADEPFKALDNVIKEKMAKELIEFSKNKTLIVIDHNLILASQVDKIIFFGLEKIHTGTLSELLKIPEFQQFKMCEF